MGGQLSGQVVAILDCDRHPEQRPFVATPQPGLGLLRLGERPLGEHDAKRVQLRLEALDAVERPLHQLGRRYLTRPDQLGLLRGPRECQIVVHCSARSIWRQGITTPQPRPFAAC